MKRLISLMLCAILLFPSTLTGCAESADSTISSAPVLPEMSLAYTTQEFYTRNGEKQIYGVLYRPQGANEKYPAVIFSHGFDGNYQVGAQYADALAAKGYVVYCFDFCGGSTYSRSDGSPLEMSIFTEQSDLEAVLHTMQQQPFVDEQNIFLMGTSQGGAVSAITAAANPDAIRGAVLLYPAFNLVENTQERFQSAENIPDTYFQLWMTVGRAYAEPLMDYDIYSAAAAYPKDVLLLHGDADTIVPLSYSQKALDYYTSARLEVLPGAGHGFYGQDAEQAVAWMLEYLNKQKR